MRKDRDRDQEKKRLIAREIKRQRVRKDRDRDPEKKRLIDIERQRE